MRKAVQQASALSRLSTTTTTTTTATTTTATTTTTSTPSQPRTPLAYPLLRHKQQQQHGNTKNNNTNGSTSVASEDGGEPTILDQASSTRRKASPEEAALTAKNYRLAKELSELRIRHREETKTVNRLTMENMNLASRCREALALVSSLKREMEHLQKQQQGVRGISPAVKDTSSHRSRKSRTPPQANLSSRALEVAKALSDMDEFFLTAATRESVQNFTPEHSTTRPKAPPTPEDDVNNDFEELDAMIANVTTRSQEDEDLMMIELPSNGRNDEHSLQRNSADFFDASQIAPETKSLFFPFSATPQVPVSTTNSNYNEEFPGDITAGQYTKQRQMKRSSSLRDFAEGAAEDEINPKSSASNTDAFDASFVANFDSFSSPATTANTSTTTSEASLEQLGAEATTTPSATSVAYNPFSASSAPSPKEKQTALTASALKRRQSQRADPPGKNRTSHRTPLLQPPPASKLQQQNIFKVHDRSSSSTGDSAFTSTIITSPAAPELSPTNQQTQHHHQQQRTNPTASPAATSSFLLSTSSTNQQDEQQPPQAHTRQRPSRTSSAAIIAPSRSSSSSHSSSSSSSSSSMDTASAALMLTHTKPTPASPLTTPPSKGTRSLPYAAFRTPPSPVVADQPPKETTNEGLSSVNSPSSTLDESTRPTSSPPPPQQVDALMLSAAVSNDTSDKSATDNDDVRKDLVSQPSPPQPKSRNEPDDGSTERRLPLPRRLDMGTTASETLRDFADFSSPSILQDNSTSALGVVQQQQLQSEIEEKKTDDALTAISLRRVSPQDHSFPLHHQEHHQQRYPHLHQSLSFKRFDESQNYPHLQHNNYGSRRNGKSLLDLSYQAEGEEKKVDTNPATVFHSPMEHNTQNIVLREDRRKGFSSAAMVSPDVEPRRMSTRSSFSVDEGDIPLVSRLAPHARKQWEPKWDSTSSIDSSPIPLEQNLATTAPPSTL